MSTTHSRSAGKAMLSSAVILLFLWMIVPLVMTLYFSFLSYNLLRSGYIEQVGSPLDLYREPANVFVAGFIGSPAMNLTTGPNAEEVGATTIGVRPKHFSLSHDSGKWSGVAVVSEHLGSGTFLRVDVEGICYLTARADGEFPARHGDTVYLTPDPERVHRFDQNGILIRS